MQRSVSRYSSLARISRPAVVDQHEVKFFRPVLFARRARAAEDVGVDRDRLAGRAARQQLEHHRQVRPCRGTTFSIPTRLTSTRGVVTLCRWLPSFSTQQTCPVSATRKFPPVMPKSARAELVAQVCAGLHRQALGVVVVRRAEILAEQLRDRRPVLVHDRRDEVAIGLSWLICTMNSPRSVSTTSIPASFERVREVDLLADHRFALDAARAVRRRGDVEDDLLGLGAVGGEVNVPAVLRGRLSASWSR